MNKTTNKTKVKVVEKVKITNNNYNKMKTITKLILSVALGGLIVSGSAFAQNNTVKDETEKTDKQLKEEQKALEKKQDRAEDLIKAEKNADKKEGNLEKAEKKLEKREKAVEKADKIVERKERQKNRADKKVERKAQKIKKANQKEADARKEKEDDSTKNN